MRQLLLTGLRLEQSKACCDLRMWHLASLLSSHSDKQALLLCYSLFTVHDAHQHLNSKLQPESSEVAVGSGKAAVSCQI